MGLPGQVIQWGAWSEVGEAEEQRARIEKQLAVGGVGWLTPEQGIEALARVVRHDLGTALVVRGEPAMFVEAGAWTPPPFFDDVAAWTAAGEARERRTDLLALLAEEDETQRRRLVQAFVAEQVQSVLRLDSPPSAETGFFDVGMDSLMAVELRNRLNRFLGSEFDLGSTVVFDNPRISALTERLLELRWGRGPAEAPGDGSERESGEPLREDMSLDDLATLLFDENESDV